MFHFCQTELVEIKMVKWNEISAGQNLLPGPYIPPKRNIKADRFGSSIRFSHPFSALYLNLCSTDPDTRIGIGRIRIRGYGNFLKNPIHGYVLLFFK